MVSENYNTPTCSLFFSSAYSHNWQWEECIRTHEAGYKIILEDQLITKIHRACDPIIEKAEPCTAAIKSYNTIIIMIFGSCNFKKEF